MSKHSSSALQMILAIALLLCMSYAAQKVRRSTQSSERAAVHSSTLNVLKAAFDIEFPLTITGSECFLPTAIRNKLQSLLGNTHSRS